MQTSLTVDERQNDLWNPAETQKSSIEYDWNDPNDPPSLKPPEIARMCAQFYSEMAPMQRLWWLCRDVITNFRAYTPSDIVIRAGMEMAYFNRIRDVSFNITLPQFRNASARLEVTLPSWGAYAASDSIEDLMRAAADEQALDYYSRRGELSYAAMEMIDWGIMFGTSAMLAAMEGDNLKPEVFGPDRIRAEPAIARPEDSRFLAVSRVTTKGQLRQKFPDKQDVIDQAPPPLQQLNWWSGYQRMAPDRIEVLEVYCRSGHWFLMCGSGGAVLASGWTPQGCMPLEIHKYTSVPFDFWGVGLVEQALPGQYAYSASWNQILTNARLMSNPKILIAHNSGIAPDAFTSRAGEKIYHRAGMEPRPWQGLPLPQYAVQLPASAASAMSDSTGIHGTSQGKRTPGIVTGRAVDAMVANDEVQFGVTKRNIKKILERHGRVALLYMQAYYPQEKFIRQFDRYGSAIGKLVRSEDLSQDPQVFIEADTLFRDDVEARQQRIMQFAQMGAIPPQDAIKLIQDNRDPLRAQKPIADFVDAKRALDAVIKNGFQVQDLRQLGPDGQPVMRKTVKFYPNDNFQVFAQVTGEFIRSDAFYALPVEKQDAVDEYYRDLLQMMAPPGPPEAAGAPGGGSPPKMPPQPVGAPPSNANAQGNAGPASSADNLARKIEVQNAKPEGSDEFSK
jgi:hypothetical protein